ncbi:hypothetical protein BDW60DRAFT_94380 [Aspergillus nidulans var. acristatus]
MLLVSRQSSISGVYPSLVYRHHGTQSRMNGAYCQRHGSHASTLCHGPLIRPQQLRGTCPGQRESNPHPRPLRSPPSRFSLGGGRAVALSRIVSLAIAQCQEIT